MIDEKLLIERLEERRKDVKRAMNKFGPTTELVTMDGSFIQVIQDINQLVEEHNNGWIPCSEMLFPRYGQKVFATVRTDIATHDVIITKYERQEYWHNGIVIAWMPLPAPYKGEQK